MKTNRRLFLWLAALSPLAPALAAAAPAKPVWYVANPEPTSHTKAALGFLKLGPEEANEELYFRLVTMRLTFKGRPVPRKSVMGRFNQSTFALASALLDRGELNEVQRKLHVLYGNTYLPADSSVSPWPPTMAELLVQTFELQS